MPPLSDFLSRQIRKPRGTKTMGKVAPVNRPRNPYANQGRKPVYGNQERNYQPAPDLYSQLAVSRATPQAVQPKFGEYQQTFQSDPILQKIAALKDKSIEQARTDAAAARQQAVIESGMTGIGQEFGVGQGILDAAQGNPFSSSADISNEFAKRQHDIDEYLNSQGLFYSSERSKQLSDVGTARARAEAELAARVRALFGQIGSNLTDAELAAEQQAIDSSMNVDPMSGGPPVPPPDPGPSSAVTPDSGFANPFHELLGPAPVQSAAQQGYTYLPDGTVLDQFGNIVSQPSLLESLVRNKGAVL